MSKDFNTFLESLLEISDKFPVSRHEEKLLRSEGDLGLIYQRVTSTKFRKSGVEKETEKFIKNYIDRAIKNKKPIRLYFLFGGYKQARLSSAPFPEWAEIFNINFALQAASSIESIYKPGVEVIYRGDEVVVTYLDNYKVESRDIYTKKFKEFINFSRSKIPPDRNIELRYELTSETSPEIKLFSMMEKLYKKYEDRFEELPKETREQKILKSYRNQSWSGEKDLTGLSDEEKRERARWAYIMHDAFLEADVKIAEKYFDEGISITFRRDVPLCLHYGACSSSSVQFWAGEGFLVERENRLIPWIYSYEQMENLDYTKIEVNVEEFNNLGLKSISIVSNK